MTVWPGPDGYWASDDPSLIDIDRVHEWLSTLSYWAKDRPRHVTETAVARSLNLGLYDLDATQVGFCRWVTDGATFAWLCDVFVAPAHRAHGLGVFMIGVATAHPEVNGLRSFLGTKDAHDLYAKFGFAAPAHPERLMEALPDRATPSP